MPIPPGAREVVPEAEAARIAEDRIRRPACEWPVLLEEQHQVSYGDEVQWIHIRVSVERPRPVPVDLGARLADVIRRHWPKPGHAGD